MEGGMNERQEWNEEVKAKIKTIESVVPWLKDIENDPDKYFEWDSQKSAHQAARFLELAMWEMSSLQYFQNKKQRRLWKESGEQTADEGN